MESAGGFLKKIAGPHPRVSDSVGLGWEPRPLPGDTEAADSGAALRGPLIETAREVWTLGGSLLSVSLGTREPS